MKGDFTRNTFDPTNHFARVLMQQGRVQLDADWNEQSAILLRYLHTLATDLIGPHAGPQDALGFGIDTSDSNKEDFKIGSGRYYVQGILCENEEKRDEKNELIPLTYSSQVDYPSPPQLPDTSYLVYLDVWERHITHYQDPEIREVALGGPDTSTRSKIVWQVKTAKPEPDMDVSPTEAEWSNLVEKWQPKNRGMLKAGVKQFEVDESTEPCNVSPDSRYRGAENQLYRVEIHKGGQKGTATFKWSRENGSVTFPILKLSGDKASLEHLGRDERFSLREGDIVEIVDDGITLRGEDHSMFEVKSIDRDRLVVILDVPNGATLPVYDETSTSHPLLRRWDHKQLDPTLGFPEMSDDSALVLDEDEDNWLLIEDGIQVYFEPTTDDNPHIYRTGDYWLIPARTATGDVEWPGPAIDPDSVPPHGVQHHYAPLAIVDKEYIPLECRRRIKVLWKPF
jgi:hypothetical protein